MTRRELSPREQELALAAIEKGQQMAGHFPTADDSDRAARVLSGETSVEDAGAELDAMFGKPQTLAPGRPADGLEVPGRDSVRLAREPTLTIPRLRFRRP